MNHDWNVWKVSPHPYDLWIVIPSAKRPPDNSEHRASFFSTTKKKAIEAARVLQFGTMQMMVENFHKGANFPVGKKPGFVNEKTDGLRYELVREELEELGDAIGAADIVEAADAIGDLLYVVFGAAVTFGIDMMPVFLEIQRTNMAKLGGPVRADGKLLKPEGWQPPDIAKVLEEQ